MKPPRAKYRKLVPALVLTGLIVGLFPQAAVAASSAGTVDGDSSVSCLTAADTKASEIGAGAYDFACLGDEVSVVPIEGSAAATLSAPSGARAAQANVADCNMPDPSYWRSIISELEEAWENCIIFGRKSNPNGPPDWVDSIRHDGHLYPGWMYHNYKFRITPFVHATTGLSYTASLFKNNGIFPPSEIDFHPFTDTVSGYGSWGTASGSVANWDWNKEGTFHFRLHTFRITVPSEGFDVTMSSVFDHIGHRFSCETNESFPEYSQCRFPGGSEAPV